MVSNYTLQVFTKDFYWWMSFERHVWYIICGCPLHDKRDIVWTSISNNCMDMSMKIIGVRSTRKSHRTFSNSGCVIIPTRYMIDTRRVEYRNWRESPLRACQLPLPLSSHDRAPFVIVFPLIYKTSDDTQFTATWYMVRPVSGKYRLARTSSDLVGRLYIKFVSCDNTT